jgi:energy-coupling factor transporter ATP-binding protein EcfA2
LVERAIDQAPPVVITTISEIKNANRLSPNQTLSFGSAGITIVFGYNGSGKTGYARILKQLCRARRSGPELILGNVYSTSKQPAAAKVEYSVSGMTKSVGWTDGSIAPSELSQISVFDANTAPLYADHQSAIEYLPWGLDVLPNMGRVLQSLSAQLQSEIDICVKAMSVQLPQQVAGTAAAAMAARLAFQSPLPKTPTETEIGDACRWDEAHNSQLTSLEEDLRRLSEPAKAAAQCRRFKVTVDSISDQFEKFYKLLSPAAMASYEALVEAAAAASSAAKLAAERSFDRESLGLSVGTAAWKRMYEAAEEFQRTINATASYSESKVGDICLLCQQPLSEDAADRMRRFAAYMRDTTQREAIKQQKFVQDVRTNLENLPIPENTTLDVQVSEVLANEPEFRTSYNQLLGLAAALRETRKDLLLALDAQSSFPIVSNVDPTALENIRAFAKNLDERAAAFDAAVGDNSVVAKLKSDHLELVARQRLCDSRALLLERRDTLDRYQKLRRCKEECDTSKISRRNSEFREKYLTAQFEKDLRSEITKLGLNYLPLKVEAKTERGTSLMGVGLETPISVRNASILSEGEFRALALSCFFAEIAGLPQKSGIVVDDPVSSLDHRHVRQVADRLIDETQHRPQVIVFTHDLSFYYELWHRAAEKGVPVTRHWIRFAPPDHFGVVRADESPWATKDVAARTKSLHEQLAQIPIEQHPEARAKEVTWFYTRLRETWERLVEERLFNGVVGRFQPGVQTLSLRGVLVTDSDYRLVYFQMKRASERSGHDWAAARLGELPSIVEMTKDLQILKEYDSQLKKRTDDLAKQRRDLEEPKAPQAN